MNDECVELDRGTNSEGYVVLHRDGKSVYAHRWVYHMTIGDIPEGMVVMHKCDNRKCINPDHLKLGTHADNRADCVAKGRHATGSQNGRAKLSEPDIPVIRYRLAIGEAQKSIAEDFDVSPRAIRKIKTGENWSHV